MGGELGNEINIGFVSLLCGDLNEVSTDTWRGWERRYGHEFGVEKLVSLSFRRYLVEIEPTNEHAMSNHEHLKKKIRAARYTFFGACIYMSGL